MSHANCQHTPNAPINHHELSLNIKLQHWKWSPGMNWSDTNYLQLLYQQILQRIAPSELAWCTNLEVSTRIALMELWMLTVAPCRGSIPLWDVENLEIFGNSQLLITVQTSVPLILQSALKSQCQSCFSLNICLIWTYNLESALSSFNVAAYNFG
jgi:hypothetical protein